MKIKKNYLYVYGSEGLIKIKFNFYAKDMNDEEIEKLLLLTKQMMNLNEGNEIGREGRSR